MYPVFKPRFVACALVALVFLPTARGQIASKSNILRENDSVIVDAKGDAVYTGRLGFPNEAIYGQIKSNFPNPYVLLRNILGSMGKSETTNATVTYDDSKRALQLGATMLGAATVDKRGKWKMDVGKNTELLYVDDHTAILINASTVGEMAMVVSGKVELPAGAKHVRVDSDTGHLYYELDHEIKAGTVALDADLKVKPRIMSALYKVYGNDEFNQGTFWTAKTVFTNNGTGDITRLKVSYRIGDYTSWSPTVEYALVAPGGHVVNLYYPLLSKDTALLKSRTPVDLEVKYSYTDSTGKEYSDSTSKRITILGGNGFEYSNSTDEERTNTWSDNFSNNGLLAAFVTKLDDPVRAFGGMVAQLCNGQPAGKSDDAAILYCQALYNLELENGIAYQWSVGLLTENGGVSQELKYPRDVLRDKSGTCIELALLYASVCETAGLKCYVMLIPGHAFPVVQLPSGQLLPVESTGLSGPALDAKHKDPFTFKEAVNIAQYEFGHREIGHFAMIDVDEQQRQGVLCPELGILPSDIVNNWGYRLPRATPPPPQNQMANGGGNGGNGGGGNGGGGNGGGGNGGGNVDPTHPAPLVATWKTQVRAPNGSQLTLAISLGANGRYTSIMTAPNANPNRFEGQWTVDDNHNLVLKGDNAQNPEIYRFQVNAETLEISNEALGGTLKYTRQ